MRTYEGFAEDLKTLHPAQLLTLEDKAKAEQAADVLAIIQAEWERRGLRKS